MPDERDRELRGDKFPGFVPAYDCKSKKGLTTVEVSNTTNKFDQICALHSFVKSSAGDTSAHT